jgi:outer membrane receptor for ferrienterochelin and colicins
VSITLLWAALVLGAAAPDAVATKIVDAGQPVAEPADAGADLDGLDPLQTVVTASRAERKLQDVVTPTEVITRAQIEATGAQDLGDLVAQHPGVEIVYTFRGAGIRLQGLDPEYVLVLVDGERVNGRVGGTVDLARFSLRDIERVEITKGPAGALYGADAIGGVINLITRRVTKPLEGTVRGSLGTRGKWNVTQGGDLDVRGTAGTRLNRWEARVGGGYRGAIPYDLNPADPATSGAGFIRYDVDLATRYTVPDKGELKLRGGYLRRDEQATDLSNTGALFKRRNRTETFEVMASGKLATSETSDLGASVAYNLYRDQLLQDQVGSRALDQYTRTLDRQWQGAVQGEKRVGTHSFLGGVELLTEALTSDRLTGPGQRVRLGLFGQTELDLLPGDTKTKLRLVPGMRVDLDSQFGSAQSPRLALKYDPSPKWTVRAAYGWGFRSPSFQELLLLFENPGVGYIVVGNPALKAEHSQGINLAIDYRPPGWEGWLFSVSAFRTDIADMITVVTDAPVDVDNPAVFAYGNIASAYTQGVETSARVKLSRGAYVEVGYTFVDTRDNTKNRPLDGRANHRANFQLGAKYRPHGLEVVVRGSVSGARPFFLDEDGDDVEETHWFAPYVDLDVQLTYQPWNWLTISVGGTNLINAVDAQFLVRPPRGAHLALQVQY